MDFRHSTSFIKDKYNYKWRTFETAVLEMNIEYFIF